MKAHQIPFSYLLSEFRGNAFWKPSDHFHCILPLNIARVTGKRLEAESNSSVLACEKRVTKVERRGF